MTGDLRERLADLAEEARPETAPAYDDLWRRGTRRRNRERATVVGALGLVLACLGSLVALVAPARDDAAPAGSGDSVGLPDTFYAMPAWTGGTADHPIGPLVAIFGAERKTWSGITQHSRSALVGVSATTGEYRFLDLPGAVGPGAVLASSPQVGLSPDGTRVGYWLAGRVSDDDGASADGTTGFAVYDTRTGAVERHLVESPQGLDPDGITWTPGRAWFRYGVVDGLTADHMSARYGASAVMDLDDGSVTPSDDLDQRRGPETGPGGFLLGGRRIVQVTAPGASALAARLDRTVDQPSVGPRGTYLAALPAGGDCCADRPLLMADVSAPGSAVVQVRRVPGVRTSYVLGWRDSSHVVVQDSVGEVRSVDVITGRSSHLTDVGALDLGALAPTFATGLLAAPVVTGREPPQPGNPMTRTAAATGVGAFALVGLGVLVVGWTRRRRERP